MKAYPAFGVISVTIGIIEVLLHTLIIVHENNLFRLLSLALPSILIVVGVSLLYRWFNERRIK